MNLKERRLKRLILLSERLDRDDEWNVPPYKLMANPDSPTAVKALNMILERSRGHDVRVGYRDKLRTLIVLLFGSVSAFCAFIAIAYNNPWYSKLILLIVSAGSLGILRNGPSHQQRRQIEKFIRIDEIIIVPNHLRSTWTDLCNQQHASNFTSDEWWSYVWKRYFSVLQPYVQYTRHQVFDAAGAENQREITRKAKGVMRPIIEELRAEIKANEQAAATERQLAAEHATMLAQAKQADIARQLPELPNNQDVRNAFNQE